jgi:hypothetical protein
MKWEVGNGDRFIVEVGLASAGQSSKGTRAARMHGPLFPVQEAAVSRWGSAHR